MYLPITSYHSIEHYVFNLTRAEDFYTKVLGFKTIGYSTAESEKSLGMKRLVVCGGKNIHVILSSPLTETSVAALYLKQHPEGIGFLNFETSDLDRCINFLKPRNATFLFEPYSTTDAYGHFSQIAIATALDDVSIRFVESGSYSNFAPSFHMTQPMGSYTSPHGYECFDHLTSNVKTLQPLVAFYKRVLGFKTFWGIEFHTNDINPDLPAGSGLKSAVMWHPQSGIKFANNEPAPPYFRNSQIDIFLKDNHGSGVQHVALRVPKIIPVMEKLRQSQGKFLEAPQMYYDGVMPRLTENGFEGKIKENFAELQKHSILVDGSSKGYLLQIFSHELSRQQKDEKAGPLFFEIIQREGDDGFGGGNFRALFETIEIDQIAMAKTAKTLQLELI